MSSICTRTACSTVHAILQRFFFFCVAKFAVLMIVTRRIGTKIDTIHVDQVPEIMIETITIRIRTTNTAAMVTIIVIQFTSIRLEAAVVSVQAAAVFEAAVLAEVLEAVVMMQAHTMVSINTHTRISHAKFSIESHTLFQIEWQIVDTATAAVQAIAVVQAIAIATMAIIMTADIRTNECIMIAIKVFAVAMKIIVI